MAYSKIIHTKSEAVGAAPVPNSLSYGEIAINYSDGHLYIKKADNTVKKVASTDFPLKITALEDAVDAINATVGFLDLQFVAATDLNFGRGNVNANSDNDALTYGLENEVTNAAERSIIFGSLNEIQSEDSIAIGDHNRVLGKKGVAIGSYITSPTNVFELGTWSEGRIRTSSVRIANENVAMTLKNSNSAILPSTAGALHGAEGATTLPENMYVVRRAGEEVLIDVNIGGAVKSCSMGDASASPGSAVQNFGSPIAGEILVKTIRKLTQEEYTDLGSDIDPNTLYIVA